MPFISLQDQGFYQPGQVMQDSVQQFLRARQQKQNLEQQQQQFATEQAVREASAGPQIDPAVIRAKVLAAQIQSSTGAKDAGSAAALPFWIRQALGKGQLPTQTETGTTLGPDGTSTTSTTNSLPSGQKDPVTGQELYSPFSGTQTKTPLARPTAGTMSVTSKGPGYIISNDQEYVAKDPGVPLINPDGTVNQANAILRSQVPKFQRTSRITETEFATSVLDDPNASEEAKSFAQGVLNKKGATAMATPADPNKPKQGPTNEFERQTARLEKLQSDLKDATDPEEIADLKTSISRVQKRVDFLNTRGKPAIDMSFLNDDGAAGEQPPTAANGQPPGSKMPDGAAAKIKAARAAQPVAAGSDNSRPVVPASTQGKIPAQNTGKWITGKVYTDGSGNKAIWDGDGWIPQ